MDPFPLKPTIIDVLVALRGAPDKPPHAIGVVEMMDASLRDAGTIYLLLTRLETRGWVAKRFIANTPIRPARRFYQLTADGTTHVDALLERARTEMEPDRWWWTRLFGHGLRTGVDLFADGVESLIESLTGDRSRPFPPTHPRTRALRRSLVRPRKESSVNMSHADCPEQLRRHAAQAGMNVQVHTVRPESVYPYTPQEYTCPHGVPHWILPTSDQKTRWDSHEFCGDAIRERLARFQNLDVEVVQSRRAPRNVFIPTRQECPHGKTFWYWPSRKALEAMADEIMRRAGKNPEEEP